MATTSAAQSSASPLGRDIASFVRHLSAGNLSPKTIRSYREAVERFAAFLADQGMPTALEALRREHVEAFIVALLERWRPATAHNRYAALQAFFRWALDEGLITESPMARMRPPKIPEDAPAILREDELRRLLAEVDRDRRFAGRRDAALLRVFIDTGARRSEVANLRWAPDEPEANDVDLELGQLRLIGKGRRERLVAVGRQTVRALDRYLPLRDRHDTAHLPWLWLGPKGRFTDSGIAQMVQERARAAGSATMSISTSCATPTLSRLRKVARSQSLWELRSRLASRAERRSLRAHSSDLVRLAAEDGVVRTGARFAAEAGLGLVASDAPVELYLDAATERRLERRYRLRPSDDPNVIARVVPDEVRSWLTAPVAPRTAVALDLAEDPDPRSQQVARDVLSAR